MFFEEYDSQKEMQNQMENMKKVPESTEKENSGQVVGKKDMLKGTENQEKYNEAIENILGKKAGYETVFTYAWNGLTDKIDIGNGEVIEKKVRWFEKEFKGDNEGKSVSVRESENWDIVFTFLNSVNWVNQSTIITLSNMMKKVVDGGDQSDWNSEISSSLSPTTNIPTIKIDWNTENLPKFLNDVLTNSQWESIINWEIKLSNDNADNFMKIFETLHNNIIKPKIEEINGYVDNVRKEIENSLNKWKHADNWYDISEANDFSRPKDLDVFIDSLLVKINESWGFQLDANKVLLSLCVLLRSSNRENIYKEINRRLWYEAENSEWVNKKSETLLSENAVEFLPFSWEEFDFFILNRDVLIDFAKEEAPKLRDEKIRDIEREMEEYQSNPTVTMRDDWLNRNRQVMTKIDPVLSEKQKEKENIQIKTSLILDCLNK